MFRQWALLLLLLAGATNASAIELYTVIAENCEVRTGVFVHVNDKEISVFEVDGSFSKMKRDQIKSIVVYNTLENPIKQISENKMIQSNLREVYVDDRNNALFKGWPIKFIEELVIFIDTKGKTQVLTLEKIQKIRKGSLESSEITRIAHRNFKFEWGDSQIDCKNRTKSKGSPLKPTRVFSDKIQINEFLSNFQKGFIEFESYEERTYLYARPILFPQETRMGFVVSKEYQEHPFEQTQVPMYFQWGSGEPYHFQNFNQIGSVPVEYLPTTEPFPVIRSDVKSHLFHGSFVGNLHALPAGTEFYTQKALPLNGEKEEERIHTASAPNYVALLGVDYGPWSLSFGNNYQTYMIQVKTNFREVLASRVTPLLRLMYTLPKLRFRLVMSQKKQEVLSGEITDLNLTIDNETSAIGIVESFDFDSEFVRFGADYDWNKDLSFSADLSYLNASYKEELILNDSNFMDFRHLIGALKVSRRFSDYVNVIVYGNYFVIDRDYSFGGEVDSTSTSEFLTGGQFEFIF